MEKGMESCSWYNVLDKKTLSNTEFLGWMKRQQQQQKTNTISTTTATGPNITPPHHHDYGDEDDDDDHGGGATAAAGVVPVGSTTTNIYPSHQLVSSGAYAIGGPITTFHYSPYPGGGGMGMGMGMAMARDFPFTSGQWRELERQAMVYKCMISSVPVPPHLLYPLDSISTAPSLLLYGGGGTSTGSGRYSRKGDLEPGRCKRTDGKKWRCSREVAPLQKYCDRHLHRGRPRSRKPVELNNNNNNNSKKSRTKSPPLPLFKPKTHLTISTPYFNGATNNTNRNLGVNVMRQPWEDPNPMQAEIEIGNQGLSDYRSSFDHDYAPLDLFSYPNIPSQGMDMPMPMPAGFIGAKSLNDGGDLSPSLNLSMAMAVGDVLDEQMRNIQTTRGDDEIETETTTEDLVWVRSPGCWEAFGRGGPLAEALQPGASNPASPYNSSSGAVSSPSGVLQRTLFSHSDGSACNSPTPNFRLMGN